MKKETALFLIFIFSVSLLIPLSEQEQTVNVLPAEKLSVVYNLHNPTLQLTTDKTTNILVNISKIDETGKASKEILNQDVLINKLEINDLKSGLYEITFISTEIVRVGILGKGIFLLNLIIIGVLFLITLVVLYIKYND